MSELRIFHVGTDFIVANDIETAKTFYVEMAGDTDPTRLKEIEDDSYEVPAEKWASMKIVDVDEPGHPERTFREAVDDMLTWENQEYPKVIASSEY